MGGGGGVLFISCAKWISHIEAFNSSDVGVGVLLSNFWGTYMSDNELKRLCGNS